MAFLWKRNVKPTKKSMKVQPRPLISGVKFTLKGSPRYYDDVKQIIEEDGTAAVYFGEELMYERGAGVAQWRIVANQFGWLDRLYDWWAEMERIEPINTTFHLYLPDDLSYPVLDLRQHTPQEVARYLVDNAPRVEKVPVTTKPSRTSSGSPEAWTNYGGNRPRPRRPSH